MIEKMFVYQFFIIFSNMCVRVCKASLSIWDAILAE